MLTVIFRNFLHWLNRVFFFFFFFSSRPSLWLPLCSIWPQRDTTVDSEFLLRPYVVHGYLPFCYNQTEVQLSTRDHKSEQRTVKSTHASRLSPDILLIDGQFSSIIETKPERIRSFPSNDSGSVVSASLPARSSVSRSKQKINRKTIRVIIYFNLIICLSFARYIIDIKYSN